MAGTLLRLVLVSLATGFLGYVLIGAIKGKGHPLLVVPAAIVALVVLLCDLPGQIKIVARSASTTTCKPEDAPTAVTEAAPGEEVEAASEDTPR